MRRLRLLWVTPKGPGERIAHVPAAAVAHSHSMTFREGRFRFHINGLATDYARRRRVHDGARRYGGGP
jgi:hypothetical protein